MGMRDKTCPCPHHAMHHTMKPVLLLILGFDFLLGAMGVVTNGFVQITWPIIIIIIAIMMMAGGKCKCDYPKHPEHQ